MFVKIAGRTQDRQTGSAGVLARRPSRLLKLLQKIKSLFAFPAVKPPYRLTDSLKSLFRYPCSPAGEDARAPSAAVFSGAGEPFCSRKLISFCRETYVLVPKGRCSKAQRNPGTMIERLISPVRAKQFVLVIDLLLRPFRAGNGFRDRN
jgi:hypothetical protein